MPACPGLGALGRARCPRPSGRRDVRDSHRKDRPPLL